MNLKPLVIGICGGSGSGKTTLLHKLIDKFGADYITLFSLDNYYLPRHQQELDEKGKPNFDLPTALNLDKIIIDLKKLIEGESIVQDVYNFNTDDNTSTTVLHPAPVILVEGLFVLYYQELIKFLDAKIFILVDKDVKLKRRLKRDVKYRGYPEEDVLYQWERHVLPAYEKYIDPFQKEADIVIKNNEDFEIGWQEFCQLIESKQATVN